MYTSLNSIIYYMSKNGYTPPDKQQIIECVSYVIKHKILTLFGSKKNTH